MINVIKTLAIFFFLVFFLFALYALILKPIISTWGASRDETSMSMAGDGMVPFVESTRAITINAPKAEVWKWVNQLGADRGGFFSYYFIERVLGYETRGQGSIKPDFQVGDVVRGSVDPKNSAIVFEFPVKYVEPGRTFVLENWGTFLVREISPKQTRLIVRTQGFKRSNPWLSIADYIGTPLHYIMERRMLMGIKAHVEAGDEGPVSPWADISWFFGMVLSGMGIFVLILIERGFKSVLWPSALSVLWLLTLLLFDPTPSYSIGLLILVFVVMILDIRAIGKKGIT